MPELGDTMAATGFLWRVSFQQVLQAVGGAAQSYVKSSEERVDGAYVVETHLVDQLLEHQGIVGEEVDAPLPIVEADGSGDDLFYFSGIAATYHAVFVHLALALFHGKRVPVLVFAAAAVHGIKTNVAIRRHRGKEARLHRLFLARDGFLDGLFPLLRVWFYAAISERLIGLQRRFVEP